MDKKRENIVCSRQFLLILFGILICAGACVVFIAASRSNRMIMLASTLPEEPNEDEAPDTTAPSNDAGPPVQQPADSSVHALTQAAVKLGVFSCLKRINQVALFLTANNKSGVFIFTPQDAPDEHVFSTSFELIRQDDTTLYASTSFFPNNDAVYDTVEYVERSCEELQQTVFKHLERKGVVKKNIVVLDGGAVKVFLMPAGSGCVVIKKEVVQ
jgi:hypothetical protein